MQAVARAREKTAQRATSPFNYRAPGTRRIIRSLKGRVIQPRSPSLRPKICWSDAHRNIPYFFLIFKFGVATLFYDEILANLSACVVRVPSSICSVSSLLHKLAWCARAHGLKLVG